uniref:Uncharacterized protein n=1 Tax=Rhizophora mucronata TaxID=61149 RepID=A0A2P2PPY4_RHIMU
MCLNKNDLKHTAYFTSKYASHILLHHESH